MSTIGDISYRTKWLVSKRYVQAALVIGLVTLGIAIPLFRTALALTDVGCDQGVTSNCTFELDGNIVRDSTNSSGLPTDWGALFDSSGNTVFLPPGGLDAHWINDGPHATTDNSTFTTGSKDTLDIANAGWQCAPANNLTPKDDILHAYSFGIIPTSGPRKGDTLLYGGFERFSNNGAGNLGFWLLQDPTVGCSSPKGAANFSGAHVVGDILITANFTIGGSVTALQVFQWVGISKATPSGLSSITGNIGTDCTSASSSANICARANTGTISTPWPTQAQGSKTPPNTLLTAEFFEVGLDLTRLHPGICVNTFLFDTRSSPSLTATLFDFATGALTSCPTAKISTAVSPTPITLGQSATDKATVTLNNPSFSVSGSVTFNVYGPFSTDPTGNTGVCTPGNLVTPFSPDTKPIGPVSSPASVTSDSFTATAPGYYAWTATYNPASIVNGNTNSTKCGDTAETLLVIKSGIITAVMSTPIALGSSATDTATVTLTPSGLTVSGTATFNVYGPFSTDPTGNTGLCTSGNLAKSFSPKTIGPTASPASVTSDSFTAPSAGFYAWTANYSPASVANGPPANTTCGDLGETLLVIGSSIVTVVSPSVITFGQSATDKATVTLTPGGQTVSGMVTFKVYGPFSTDPTGNTAACTGSFTTLGPVSISGVSPASATSPSFTPSAPGFYAWIASYASNGQANGPNATTTCGDSGETLQVSSIPKITAFDFTNAPTGNDPTLGSGTVTYAVKIHNYGAAPVMLSGSLTVGGSATITPSPCTVSLSDPSLAAGTDVTFNLSCSYSGTSGQTVVATITAMFTDVNGVTGQVSGSPTTYTFTIQTT